MHDLKTMYVPRVGFSSRGIHLFCVNAQIFFFNHHSFERVRKNCKVGRVRDLRKRTREKES